MVSAPSIIGLVFFVVGLSLLGPAGYLAHQRQQFEGRAVRVPATVVGVDQRTNESGEFRYAAVYQYEYEGRVRTKPATMADSEPPKIGGKATLLVDPMHPEEAVADTFMDRWLLPIIFGGIGAMFWLVALVVLFLGGKVRRLT